MLRKLRRRCLLAMSFAFGVFLFAGLSRPELFIDSRRNTSEILRILETTPNLWNNNQNLSFGQRFRAQQDWYRRIAATKYVRESPVKTILLEHDLSYIYGPKLQLRCSAEPTFEDRCLIDKRTSVFDTVGPYLFPHYEDPKGAVISVINWEKRRIDSSKRLLHIVHVVEPPSVTPEAALPKKAALASYHFSSHIPLPYGFYDPDLKNTDVMTKLRLAKALETKTRIAAALVSNCKADGRLQFIHELGSFTDVQVYGKCGSQSCGEDCLQMIEEQYWFYLAFENVQCENYVTEKLFENSLHYNIVPVVRGGKKEDYVALAPPNSFIFAGDFETPAELGTYLTELTQPENREMYLSFLVWKEQTTGAIFQNDIWIDFFCRVCGLLYYAEFIPPPTVLHGREDDGSDIASEVVLWEHINKCLPQKWEAKW